MTVHTDVGGGDVCLLAFHGAGVAILALDLILTCVDLVRECDRLFGLVALLNPYREQSVDHRFEGDGTDNKYDEEDEARATRYRIDCEWRPHYLAVLRTQIALIE